MGIPREVVALRIGKSSRSDSTAKLVMSAFVMLTILRSGLGHQNVRIDHRRHLNWVCPLPIVLLGSEVLLGGLAKIASNIFDD